MNNGYAVFSSVLSIEDVNVLLKALDSADIQIKATRSGDVRNLLERVSEVRELAESSAIRRLVEPVLGARAFAVRGILFDKTPESNWTVPWHQDLTIAVSDKIEAKGYGPWTVKDGVHRVQPPIEVLESMLAVRVHLDECGEGSGPVRVIPGTHSMGRLRAEQIDAIQTEVSSVSCPVGAGVGLLMRPLLLHASSSSGSPNHRRVIHLEFASCQLADGLRWNVVS